MLAVAVPLRADTFYVFAGDRVGNSVGGSGIHRYLFDSNNPGALTPAPSVGQSGDAWGESEGQAFKGKRITGIVIAPNGDVYAASPDTGELLRFDGQTGAFKGAVLKGLEKPDGLALGPDGNLYVTNSTAIIRCRPDGTPVPGAEQIGNTFAIGGPLAAASGLAFGPDGNLYVASQGTAQVLRYDGKSGKYIDVFCGMDSFRDDLGSPSELSFGPDGHLYVACTSGLKFDGTAGAVAVFDGTTGQLLGRFADAKGALSVDFGPSGDLFVSDYWTGRITRYDAKTGAGLGVVPNGAPAGSLYYLAIAKQEDGPEPILKPWTIKAPRLASTNPIKMKSTALSNGAETVKGWANALKPKGTPGPLLTLATNNKAAYTIALAANPTPMDAKAAAVLAWTLEEMTGATFTIVREGAGAKLGSKAISIGQTELFKAAKLKEANLDLGGEGYAIATKGANLFLWGGDVRGAIYAVYSFLEEDLGCRWYSWGDESTRIPRKSTLAFKPTLRHFVPVLVTRDPYYYDAFNSEWSLRNKTDSPNVAQPKEFGGYSRHAIFVHSYNALVPPAEYFEKHPEYFSEIAGKRQPVQLCLSNPDVLRILTENVKKSLRDNPGSKFISVSPNDGKGYCECSLCSALDKAEETVPGSKSGTLINFCNKVAEAIEPEFPGVKISTLAYLDTYMPPKTIKPHENVIIQLCTDAHAWKYQFDFITESEKFQTAMKAWEAIGADMFIWDYTTSFVHYMVPMPNMPVVRENIKFYMDHGAKGVMLQGSYQSPGSDMGPMRSWVWAKQLWDPSLDTYALMKDFIYGYYGDAAAPIWGYNDMLWQIWQKNHAIPHTPGVTKVGEHPFIVEAPCSMPPDWEVLSPEFIEKTSAFFTQAEALAKDPVTKQRVQVAKLSLLYVQLGQGLGYIEELGGFKAGSWVKDPEPAKKAHYQALFQEFLDISSKARVTSISEHSSIGKLTTKWGELLNKDWSQVSVQKLSNQWKFKIDPEKNGLAQGWETVALDDTPWTAADSGLRTGWESQGFADHKGVAWYRQQLLAPAALKEKKNLRLFFGAVDSESEIYINGVKAFEHTIASTGLPAEKIWNHPFSFDPTPFLKFGEKNTIAIKVSSFGGIRGLYRPVFLVGSDTELKDEALADSVLPYG
jgi:sugar lactone lactonase YvrE